MTREHPMTLYSCPLVAYNLAGRAMEHKSRELGSAKAADLYAPRRLSVGWWSPLFDVVLRFPTVPHA